MSYRHPIYFSTTLTEASNILALGYLAAGKSWNEKDKVTFKALFSQFVKAEVDWRLLVGIPIEGNGSLAG